MPLMWPEEQIDLVRKLLEHGADPNASWVGASPLHFAASWGYVRTIAALIGAGADTAVVVQTGDRRDGNEEAAFVFERSEAVP
jgi:ankyrin repeat protein